MTQQQRYGSDHGSLARRRFHRNNTATPVATVIDVRCTNSRSIVVDLVTVASYLRQPVDHISAVFIATFDYNRFSCAVTNEVLYRCDGEERGHHWGEHPGYGLGGDDLPTTPPCPDTCLS